MGKRPAIESPVEQSAQVVPDKKQLPEKTVEPSKPVEPQKTVEPKKTVSSGKIYKVQILASIKKLPDNAKELKGYKSDYYVEGNYYKYTYGESQNWNEINELRKKIANDFKGAFIVAFENGVKVPNK